MLTVFGDMLGFLMIVPLLPIYATRFGATPFQVTLMISTYAVAQLATAPLWGRWSDRHGRRPVLMLGISISMVSHLLFAFACSNWAAAHFDMRGLVALLYVSRFVQGAGGATTGVVQAYVGDAVIAEDRAKALGWISAATSAGVAIGPAIGSIVAVADPAGPGLAAAALCVVNLVFVAQALPESTSHETRADAKKAKRGQVRRRLLEVVSHPTRSIPRLVWIYGVAMMAFMAMNSVLALFLMTKFGFTEATIGYVYSGVGITSLVMRSVVLGPAVRRLGETGVMRAGLVSLMLSFALQPFAPHIATFCLALFLIPVGTALLFPATSSLVSRFCDRSELGAVMGVQQAYGGVARLIGPIWAGASFQLLQPGAPFWISSGLAFLTLLFALGVQPPQRASASASAPLSA